MQTERKAYPAGKTKDVWDDVDESFFKVRGTEKVEGEPSWSLSRSADDAWCADTAVHPASARESCLGDLPFSLRLDPESPGQGRPHHLAYKSFLHSNLNADHWDLLN